MQNRLYGIGGILQMSFLNYFLNNVPIILLSLNFFFEICYFKKGLICCHKTTL